MIRFRSVAFGDPLPGDGEGRQERVTAWSHGQAMLAPLAAGLTSGLFGALWWTAGMEAFGTPMNAAAVIISGAIIFGCCILAGRIVDAARRYDAERLLDRLGEEWGMVEPNGSIKRGGE